MSTRASEDGDPFTLPRAEYCFGRVSHYRGDATAAVGHLRRCPVSISAFDEFMRRNLYGWLARTQAEAGDLEAATTSLALGSDGGRMKTYEPEWEFARADAPLGGTSRGSQRPPGSGAEGSPPPADRPGWSAAHRPSH